MVVIILQQNLAVEMFPQMNCRFTPGEKHVKMASVIVVVNLHRYRMDATLRELTGLIKEVNPDARRRGTYYEFAIGRLVEC